MENQEIKTQPTPVKLENYKPRFASARAYYSPEETQIVISDSEIITCPTDHYFLSLDMINNIIIPAELFKKLFIRKHT